MPTPQHIKKDRAQHFLERISIFLLVLLTALFAIKSFAGEQIQTKSVLYFAPLPMSNAKLNMAKSQPLTRLLQSTLNRPVIAKLYNNYEEILDAFQKGEIDFVELGPLVYLELSKQTNQIYPLASVNQRAGQQHYQCVLAAPIDGIQNLQQLAQIPKAKVALTQPLSTCGWLLTEQLLKQEGMKLSEMNYQFVGSHEKVALSLMRNEFQVGGLARFVAERYADFGLKILKTSQPLPQFIIAANPNTLSSQQLKRIQQAMLNYKPDETWGLGSKGFSPISMELFDELKAMEDNTGVNLLDMRHSE